mgnify:CR=1 FL=1
MTYAGFLLLFVILPILLCAVLLWRWRIWPNPRHLALIALLAVVYTTPWDNAIVRQGVWSYDVNKIWGIVLGVVPLEEYLFFVLQVILTGSLLTILRRWLWQPEVS